jgi:hypothetical protein
MRLYTYLILMLVTTPALAQYSVGLSTGYGAYSMNSLKEFQKELLIDFPTDSRITETFPGFLYYEFSVVRWLNDEKYISGISIAYGSTGGRIHYRDYSGEVAGNQLIKYFNFTIPMGVRLYDNEKAFRIWLDIKPHVSLSHLNLEFYSRLGNQSDYESFKFRSLNFGLEAGLRAQRSFFLNWAIEGFAGYNQNIVKGELFFTQNDQAYLQNNDGDPVKVDLSGLRLSLGISYTFVW